MSRLTASQMNPPNLNKKSKFKGWRGVGNPKHPWRETPARLLRAKRKRVEPAIKMIRPDRAKRAEIKERRKDTNDN